MPELGHREGGMDLVSRLIEALGGKKVVGAADAGQGLAASHWVPESSLPLGIAE